MNDYLIDRNATQQIRERVEQTQRSTIPRQRRHHAGRQALARRLHSFADRLDA